MVRVKTQNIRLIQAQDSQNGWMVKVLQRFKHAHSGYIRNSFKFISKANSVYKRSYSFRTNIMEEIFEIRSCVEMLANDIKI